MRQKREPRVICLADGREVVVDLDNISWSETGILFLGAYVGGTREERLEAATNYAGVLGKACGLTAEEMMALNYNDFDAIQAAVLRLMQQPLEADPN